MNKPKEKSGRNQPMKDNSKGKGATPQASDANEQDRSGKSYGAGKADRNRGSSSTGGTDRGGAMTPHK